jgi:transcriptional regulator with XRE-family HTH domain
MALTQKQIGQRIMELRKAKGLSQEDLSKILKISRPSLAQIELGNRGLDTLELQRLALVLQFSVDEFLAKDFVVEKAVSERQDESKSSAVRSTAFPLRIDKLRNVLLYILERCAGKPNIGETALYKLLYFADFNYYELHEESITGATYRKLPFGPVPQKLDTVIAQMINQKILQRIKTEFHGYPQTRYIPLQKPDLTQLKASEVEVVDKVIDQMSDWSASAMSGYSHQDTPWRATREGEQIDYALALGRKPPFTVRPYGGETGE